MTKVAFVRNAVIKIREAFTFSERMPPCQQLMRLLITREMEMSLSPYKRLRLENFSLNLRILQSVKVSERFRSKMINWTSEREWNKPMPRPPGARHVLIDESLVVSRRVEIELPVDGMVSSCQIVMDVLPVSHGRSSCSRCILNDT